MSSLHPYGLRLSWCLLLSLMYWTCRTGTSDIQNSKPQLSCLFVSSVLQYSNIGIPLLFSDNAPISPWKSLQLQMFWYSEVVVFILFAMEQHKLRGKIESDSIDTDLQKWTGPNYWHFQDWKKSLDFKHVILFLYFNSPVTVNRCWQYRKHTWNQ